MSQAELFPEPKVWRYCYRWGCDNPVRRPPYSITRRNENLPHRAFCSERCRQLDFRHAASMPYNDGADFFHYGNYTPDHSALDFHLEIGQEKANRQFWGEPTQWPEEPPDWI